MALLIQKEEIKKTSQDVEHIAKEELIQTNPIFDSYKYINPEHDDHNDFLTSNTFQRERELLTLSFHIFSGILKGSESVDQMIEVCKEEINELEQALEENKKAFADALVPYQELLGGVDKAFANASPTQAPVSNLEVVEIDFDNAQHLPNVLNGWKKLAMNWDSEDKSPFLICPMKKLTVDEAFQFASFAKENNSFIVGSFPNRNSAVDLLEYMKQRLNYGGPQLEWGHISMCGTPLKVRSAYDFVENDKDVYSGAGPALLGKILDSHTLAQAAAGMIDGIITRAMGLMFNAHRDETSLLNENGLIAASLTDGKIAFFGNGTLYRGDRADFKDYSKVLVRNMIQRSMIRFANTLAFRNLERSVKKDIEGQVINFLNRCKVARLIDDFDPQLSGFSINEEGIPQLTCVVRFFQSSEFFDIVLLSRDDDENLN